MRTLADGFTGAIMAVESIRDAAVLVHGPGGCRVRHMVHSTAVFPRTDKAEDFSFLYYYGYPRVPATYLDDYDYINGASYKLDEALEQINGRNPAILVVINSPGAALIGDDVEGAISSSSLSNRAFCLEGSMVSLPVSFGYGHTLREVMSFLSPSRGCARKGTVNLLGLSILDKDWMAGRDELVRMVESMGLKVLSTPGAGSSVDELMDSVEAEFNIMVCPEMCDGLTQYYESMGIPTIRSAGGSPVGFDAIEEWIGAIAEATGADPSIPLSNIASVRRRIFDKFVGMRYNASRIRGLTFSIAGIASVVRPLTSWLYSYLAMAPVAVDVDPGADPSECDALVRFLEDVDYADCFGLEPVDGSDVVLCEGVESTTMYLSGCCSIHVPIGFSSMGLDDVIPRPVYGIQGALYILDEIVHGIRGL